MRIAETKLRKLLRKVILEYGENDAQLRSKLQNRDKMIGRGMDMGKMPHNPTWDYDKRPSSNNRLKRGRVGEELTQVVDRLKQHQIGDWMEAEPTKDPNVFHIVSGDMKVKVKNNYGLFVFSMVAPRKWKGKWQSESYSVDKEIDEVLDSLDDWVNTTEMQEMGES